MRSFSFDAKKTLKGNFKPSSAAEREFYRQLKKVARASAHVVEQHTDGARITNPKAMQDALNAYARVLTPWAERQAARMLQEVQRSNKRAYQKKSKAMGVALREGVAQNGTLAAAQKLLNEQVALIKSIPIESGLRAQKIATEAFLTGSRAQVNSDTVAELQKELGLTEEVAISRARLIARTEVARANAAFNQARAVAVGSNQYRWHNSGDAAVRHSHKYLNGKRLQGMIFSWDQPPTLDDGMTGHPGSFPNCRCFAEPVFPSE